ncbi:CopD family protein [Trinickia mobilis]|uniref:CopD family protein n=1 Tax=Trinickia mobilis TaxID=2816356 RepID=UPI001A901E2B|nr:CopD family protein [Trinickia mobilis]
MEPLVVAQIGAASIQDILFATAAGLWANGVLLQRNHVVMPGWVLRWQRIAFGLLAVTAIGYLWLQAAVMGRVSAAEAGPLIAPVLAESHFGIAWMLGFAGTILAVLGSVLGKRFGVVVALGAVVYAAGKAAASHAADSGDFTLREAVHVVHLCATAMWAGSVMIAAVVLGRSALRQNSAWQYCVEFCTRLSHFATASLALVLLTGVYNAAEDTAQVTAPLVSIPYGHVLGIKLVLVTAAVIAAGWNRTVYLPSMRSHQPDDEHVPYAAIRGFSSLLAVEAVLLLVVLIVASILGHMSPSTAG